MSAEYTPMRELLRIDHLTAGYGGDVVIEDIDLCLGAGEVLGIVGESGSGKSTLLKAIAQIRGLSTEIQAGTVSFSGQDITALSESQRRRLRGTEIAMVFQYAGASLNPARTLGAQLTETMHAHTDLAREEIRARAAKVFGGMGFSNIGRILSAYPFELSGGMAQRAAIALAVILRPQLLLADEPTSALDATIQLQVLDELRARKEQTGMAILLITHNIGVVRHIADRVAVMCKGKIVEQGSVDEVLGNPQHPYTRELLAAVPKMSAATHTDCDRRDHAEKNTAPIASPVTTGERSTSSNHTSPFGLCSWEVFPYDLLPAQLRPSGLLLGQVSKWRACEPIGALQEQPLFICNLPFHFPQKPAIILRRR